MVPRVSRGLQATTPYSGLKAASDERQALADEAKFRAERADSADDEGSGRVRLGAPEQQQSQAAASDEGDDIDADEEN